MTGLYHICPANPFVSPPAMGQCLRFMTETKAEKQQRHLNAIILGLNRTWRISIHSLLVTIKPRMRTCVRSRTQVTYQAHSITRDQCIDAMRPFVQLEEIPIRQCGADENQAQTQKKSARPYVTSCLGPRSDLMYESHESTVEGP